MDHKPTHVTDGLIDEGFTRAIDIMGIRERPCPHRQWQGHLLPPTGAQGGGSMLVRFADGREVGSVIANGLPAGATFKGGSVLAQISSDHPRPHVHWSLR